MADQVMATGRRKTSVARVIVKAGNGAFKINGKTIEDYLPTEILRLVARQPLTLTGTTTKYDVVVNVFGGGLAGQAGAIRHGVARALVLADGDLKKEIKKAGLLTRDARMVERKKYGLKKARRAPQFSKR
ncbi:MAG: 30S ribosomal protein S9 [Eubacteriaceae bacterium]|nr:30S ribosomal protein S9 [Eubacteriaceae bacterium]MBR5995123.1 30S ribosomal protein S9 [Eubacteriaceae bacterium]